MTSDPQPVRPFAASVTVPWDLRVPEADIYLVGYGMQLPNDFTLEMLAVLKRCTRVFAVPPLHAPDFGLPTMEDLTQHYGPDKDRSITYRQWTDLILSAAAAEPPVAFATYGSVMCGASTAHQLLQQAPERGLRVHVTKTVSCFDGIWADLNIEPFYGFSVWEASVFLDLAIVPDTKSNLLLPQAPVLRIKQGPDIAAATIAVSSQITALRDHLLRFYPAEHPVHYIHTASGTAARTDLETMPLAKLDHPGAQSHSTLLIPRLDAPARLDFGPPLAS
ncbi:SAM-dependent methyltransferase [Nonomuraea sp. NPDC050783]|uniref:SAM-dependent methyltransferase n=1 Tax=Nonomuraea sp. NPDC050783 TaxID=3154634 RepID=UPI0034672794